MKKFDKFMVVTCVASLLLTVIMAIVTIAVFAFDAKKLGYESLKKAWEWGSAKVEEAYKPAD